MTGTGQKTDELCENANKKKTLIIVCPSSDINALSKKNINRLNCPTIPTQCLKVKTCDYLDI